MFSAKLFFRDSLGDQEPEGQFAEPFSSVWIAVPGCSAVTGEADFTLWCCPEGAGFAFCALGAGFLLLKSLMTLVT